MYALPKVVWFVRVELDVSWWEALSAQHPKRPAFL